MNANTNINAKDGNIRELLNLTNFCLTAIGLSFKLEQANCQNTAPIDDESIDRGVTEIDKPKAKNAAESELNDKAINAGIPTPQKLENNWPIVVNSAFSYKL